MKRDTEGGAHGEGGLLVDMDDRGRSRRSRKVRDTRYASNHVLRLWMLPFSPPGKLQSRGAHIARRTNSHPIEPTLRALPRLSSCPHPSGHGGQVPQACPLHLLIAGLHWYIKQQSCWDWVSE